MTAQTELAPAEVHPSDPALLAQVLRPYKDHCKYLLSADVSLTSGRASASAEFAIPESCYIDDTGHLNAVEVNICYNQMMYYLVAKSVEQGLLEEFKSWTMEDYWRHQLPDILIARFNSNFRTPINPRSFSGEMEFVSVTRRAPGGRKPFLVAETSYRYRDADGGRCDGEATLAFVNIT
ncbi:FcoT family thioesterase [Streptomyces sp. LX-29]|uniref:(2E)-enoyl-ACP glycyltransferase n=1 Tax=Streptomyces sp. LX-29 TaxID=2900152 RepID=UPI00240E6D1F|nr:FcoT family thioesterase [Streptomyces sp. LX-29]WFB10847.1 FcoT family thioesterase [Streptomyces sp. LX-29]